MGVLVQHGIKIPDEVVLQHNLVGQQMRQDGEGGCVQFGQSVTQGLVCELICVCRALEVDLMLGKGVVVAVGASLLVLECLAAALVALIVDLLHAASAG